MRVSSNLLYLCLLFWAPALVRGDARILAGPMVGHTTTTSARIWVETDQPSEITIDYWQDPRVLYDDGIPAPISHGAAKGHTASAFPHTGVIELSGLTPGGLIHYDVYVDGRPIRPLSPQVFSLMPPEVPDPQEPDELAEFNIAFGSCNFTARIPIQNLWAQVVRYRPMAFLFIGDNNYLPSHADAWNIEENDARIFIADMHRSLRDITGVRELMASTPSYGIWDDHDYGTGNSDRTFRFHDLTLDVFRQYWANPAYGTRDTPGVFYSFRIADVEFFMLDDRFYRDPNLSPDRKTMLGAGQLAWLKKSLKASTATFKVIANGGTLAVDEGKETWARFGSERDDFLQWMFAEKIGGVFFIAGDWHVGVINRLHRPQDKYPLYELLSSNLAVKIKPRERVELTEGPGNNQWVSPFVIDFNFGLLRFEGKRGQRIAILRIVDQQGDFRAELTLSESDLQP